MIVAFVAQAYRVLVSAYPVMSKGVFDSSSFSLDFGAYYTAAWRLVHNPAQLYTPGTVSGDPLLPAFQPGFKYLPFFTFFTLPLLVLPYVQALFAWDAFQYILMPVMGLLLYKAMRDFNVLIILGVVWVVLLQPIPFPPHYTLSFYDLYTSQSYYWQWTEGQAKVFEAFLVVAAYYLSKSRRPYLAGVAYGLAFFDPRFPVYAIPLFLILNRSQYKKFTLSAVATLLVGDSVLLYDGLIASFYSNVLVGGVNTPFYQYTYIPFYTVVALTVVEGADFICRTVLPRMRQNPPAGPPPSPTAQATVHSVGEGP